LYHEATLVNLLETTLYHSEVCQGLNDTIFDLIDYCYRRMSHQIKQVQSSKSLKIEEIKDENEKSPLDELKDQNDKIQFDIYMKIFSIIRYIIDNLKK
jgi:zinc finger MYND domain-containing protein 10